MIVCMEGPIARTSLCGGTVWRCDVTLASQYDLVTCPKCQTLLTEQSQTLTSEISWTTSGLTLEALQRSRLTKRQLENRSWVMVRFIANTWYEAREMAARYWGVDVHVIDVSQIMLGGQPFHVIRKNEDGDLVCDTPGYFKNEQEVAAESCEALLDDLEESAPLAVLEQKTRCGDIDDQHVESICLLDMGHELPHKDDFGNTWPPSLVP